MRRFFRDNSGAAAVEFVICMPFLVTLSIAVSELGRGLWCHHTLVQMTRDASRYLSRVSDPSASGPYQPIATNLALYGTRDGSGTLLIPASYGAVTMSYAITPVAGTWSATEGTAEYVSATASLSFTSPLIAWFGVRTTIPISVSHAERKQTD